jgi:hypothetical protein
VEQIAKSLSHGLEQLFYVSLSIMNPVKPARDFIVKNTCQPEVVQSPNQALRLLCNEVISDVLHHHAAGTANTNLITTQ